MRRFVLFILLQVMIFISYGQERIFSKYDFTKNDYSLVFIDVSRIQGFNQAGSTNEIITRPSINDADNFIIDSKDSLSKIRNNWDLKVKNERPDCWYDYFVFLTLRDSVIDVFKLSLKCQQLIKDTMTYYFDSSSLPAIIQGSKSITKQDYDFQSNRKKAIKKWNDLASDNKIILKKYLRPFWIDYEGVYAFEFVDNEYVENGNRLTPKIKKLLHDKYPNEKFELKWYSTDYGGPNGAYLHRYYIISQESLYNDFSDFKIVKGWQTFKVYRLTTYSK